MLKLEDIKIGTEISCRIHSTMIKSAKIQIEKDYVYVCQDLQNGDRCVDCLGYQFSWSVGPVPEKGTNIKNFFRSTDVNDVKLTKIPEWDTEVNV